MFREKYEVEFIINVQENNFRVNAIVSNPRKKYTVEHQYAAACAFLNASVRAISKETGEHYEDVVSEIVKQSTRLKPGRKNEEM